MYQQRAGHKTGKAHLIAPFRGRPRPRPPLLHKPPPLRGALHTPGALYHLHRCLFCEEGPEGKQWPCITASLQLCVTSGSCSNLLRRGLAAIKWESKYLTAPSTRHARSAQHTAAATATAHAHTAPSSSSVSTPARRQWPGSPAKHRLVQSFTPTVISSSAALTDVSL